MRRIAIIISAVVVVAGLGASSASAQTTDAVTVARTLIANENAHNVNAVVDMFAPGAIVNLPTGSLATRAAILQWQQELAAGNFRAEITTPVAVTPEVVTFSGTVAIDLFRSLGLASLESTWQLTIQLGKVTTFNFDFTPAAGARLGAALAAAASRTTPAASTAAGSGSGSTAAPAAASTARLALTGTNLAPAAVGGLSVLFGLLLLTVGRRRTGTARS